MKKGSVVLMIGAMMLIATGLSLSATSAQASDLSKMQQSFNYHKKTLDKVPALKISDVSGKVMKFTAWVSVDPAHGISPSKDRMIVVRVRVFPFDENGKRLWETVKHSFAKVSGESRVSRNLEATLGKYSKPNQVAYLLVAVDLLGHPSAGFKFCQLLKKTDDPILTAPPSDSDIARDKKHCGVGKTTKDRINYVNLISGSGNFYEFQVDLYVDRSHFKDVGSSPSKHLVSLFAYDKNFKRLSIKSKPLQYPRYTGRSQAFSGLQLDYGHSLEDVVYLLVTVEGQGKLSGFKFCQTLPCPKVPTMLLTRSALDRTLKNCNNKAFPRDQVHNVWLSSVSGKKLKFEVDVEVDPAHSAGMDGIPRLGPMKAVFVSVHPFDKNGRTLPSVIISGHTAKVNGRSKVFVEVNLKSNASLSQVGNLVVKVKESHRTKFAWGYKTGRGEVRGFQFCSVWYATHEGKRYIRGRSIDQSTSGPR